MYRTSLCNSFVKMSCKCKFHIFECALFLLAIHFLYQSKTQFTSMQCFRLYHWKSNQKQILYYRQDFCKAMSVFTIQLLIPKYLINGNYLNVQRIVNIYQTLNSKCIGRYLFMFMQKYLKTRSIMLQSCLSVHPRIVVFQALENVILIVLFQKQFFLYKFKFRPAS